jgi:hypothetical protein
VIGRVITDAVDTIDALEVRGTTTARRGMNLYADIQRTLAYVFAGMCAVLIVAATVVGADAWPGLCLTRSLTGASCPDCGLVRGILYLCAGDPGAAAAAHPRAPWVAAWLVLQVPVRFILARLRLRATTGLVLGAADLILCVGALEAIL